MRKWKVGSVTITQIVELLIPEGLPGLIPEATPEALFAIPWLSPDLITAKGEMSISIHAFVIEKSDKRVLVDTCIGNGKHLEIAPFWTEMQTTFLQKMRDAGLSPESIDVV